MGEKMGDVIPIPLEVSMDEDGCRSFLTESKWPKGLQDCCVKTMARVPYRIFICDDSGSMMKSDGKRIARAENEKKYVTLHRFD